MLVDLDVAVKCHIVNVDIILHVAEVVVDLVATLSGKREANHRGPTSCGRIRTLSQSAVNVLLGDFPRHLLQHTLPHQLLFINPQLFLILVSMLVAFLPDVPSR